MLEKALKRAAYDCVVIGGGLRIPPKSLAPFEMVVNAVHKAALPRQSHSTRAQRTQPKLQPANSTPANGRPIGICRLSKPQFRASNPEDMCSC